MLLFMCRLRNADANEGGRGRRGGGRARGMVMIELKKGKFVF